MRLTPLSAYERETVIVFNDEEPMASITTHQRRIVTKLERNPAARKVEDLQHGRQPGGRYELDKRLITLRTKKATRPGNASNLKAKTTSQES